MTGPTDSGSSRRAVREIRLFCYSPATVEEAQNLADRVVKIAMSEPCVGCFPSCLHVYTLIDANLDCWCVGGPRVKPCPE